MRKKTTIIVCLLLVACMLMVSEVIVAPKPPDKPDKPGGGKPGGPEATGTIYFRFRPSNTEITEIRLWSMNAADGSDKTLLPVEQGVDHHLSGGGISYFTVLGLVSRIKHNDHYWIIRFCGINDENGDPELYLDGRPRRELFAVRDDNAYNIQLTFDPTLETYGMGPELLVWGIDDSEILFGGMKWEDGILDMNSLGIYSRELVFDANELPQLSEEATFVWETGVFNQAEPGVYTLNLTGFDISPDENKLVIGQRGGGSSYINVVDLDSGIVNYIASGWWPKWSPDGTKIAYVTGGNLKTINPDGTEDQIIVAPRSNGGGTRKVEGPIFWSSDSNFIAYKELFISSRMGLSNDLYRVRADGEDNKCLTKDISGSRYLRGWP